MDTIGPIEVTRGQQLPPLEVPAGRDRHIAIVSRNDVYAGRVTTSVAPGRETTVNVPIYPGPVFMDLAGGDSETPSPLVQIRDLSAEPGTGTVRSLAANPFATDVEYAADGTVWSLQVPESEGFGPFFAGIDEFSSAEPVRTIGYGSVDDLGPPTAMAIDSRNGRIAVAELPAETQAQVYVASLSSEAVSAANSLDLEPLSLDYDIQYITGLSFDTSGIVFALAAMTPVDTPADAPDVAVLRIDPDQSTPVEYQILPYTQDPPFYGGSTTTPWGDVRVVGQRVYVASAAGEAGDPAVFAYDLDLNLTGEWGSITTGSDPAPGEFWGPRRFAATRNPSELILVDQTDVDPAASTGLADGTGRLVQFRFGTTDGWQTFGREQYTFFNTGQTELGEPIGQD